MQNHQRRLNRPLVERPVSSNIATHTRSGCPARARGRICGIGASLLLLIQVLGLDRSGGTLRAEPFSYQGRIASAGVAASGNFTMSFRLYDTATDGMQVGSEVLLPSVTATQGLFTVQLDFGPAAFDGNARWLEVSARPSGSSGSFEVLSPRQPITAVPYAIRALTASGDASLLDSGTLPDARLSPGIARTLQLVPLSNSMVELTGWVGGLSNAQQVLALQYEDLNARLLSQSNSVVGLGSWVQGLGAALLAVSNTVNGITGAVGDLQDSVNSLVGGLGSESNRLNQVVDQLNSLAAAVHSLSNRVGQVSSESGGAVPSGFVMASTDPVDPALLGQGYERFASFPAGQWRAGTTQDQPSARRDAASVWTGTDWYLWGGTLGNGTRVGTGARYSPSEDRWTTVSPINAPVARSGHTLVNAGNQLLVWGGTGAGVVQGGRHLLAEGVWQAIPALDVADTRTGHGAVWTGSRMLVWGGTDANGLHADGGLYDPISASWTVLGPAGAPEARMDAAVVWTGSELLVWGGIGESGELGTGGRLVVSGGTTPQAWQSLPTAGAPQARSAHGAVWTGSALVVWGGRQGATLLGDGAIYHPGSNSWTAISLVGAPTPRAGHQMVWTGEEVLVQGGEGSTGYLSDGAAYDPVRGRWRALPTPAGGPGRSQSEAAWTGSELLIFGGLGGTGPLASLQRLDPAPEWHLFRKP